MRKEVHGGNIYKYDHEVVDFSANMNPLGMPDQIKEAIIENIDKYENYPDPFNRELIEAIRRFYGIDPDRICCGNGAADIIFRIALALKPKKGLIVGPTFSEYKEALDVVSCQTYHHILTEEKNFILGEDVLQSMDKSYDIMFLCNPNNPTGIPVKRDLILKIAKKCKDEDITLVIDECFTEFLDEEEKFSVMDQIEKLDQVIILKAFTKIYAMAGIRLGFCVCGDIKKADLINQMLQPWSVSTVASKAGTKALSIPGFIEKTKEYVCVNREYLLVELEKLGFKTFGAKANYVFFKSDIELESALDRYNILIRSCANYITLDKRFYRIAVRTKEENQYLIDSLTKIREEM